jgi:hypothetical protein
MTKYYRVHDSFCIQKCRLVVCITHLQVLLHGASTEELKKVKKVVQFAVFAAYHLALETSFLADEGATLPELPLDSPISVVIPARPCLDRSISSIPGFTIPSASGQSHVRVTLSVFALCCPISCAYNAVWSILGKFDDFGCWLLSFVGVQVLQ